ncbi:MAG: hypothetical protein HYY29_05630 [Chloroflexi bacterium]|nr:hypothetical protein [Chloroflexota bacterium]
MKHSKVHLLLALVSAIFFVSVFPVVAVAQVIAEPTGFQNVRLWVNPEYDDPRLLVMLEGQIVGASAPATVRFLVPAAAEMFSAGSKDAQGRYSGGPPNRKPSGVPGWDEISYNLTSNTFRMEYYDPVVAIEPDKKIAFQFRSLYPISDLRVMLQQPLTSSNFKATPQEISRTTDSDRMTVFNYDFRDVPPNSPLSFDISYTKTDPNPSVKDPVLQGAGTGSSSAGSSKGPLIVIGVVAAIAFVALFGFTFMARSRRRATTTRQQRRFAEARSGHQSQQARHNRSAQRGPQVPPAPAGPRSRPPQPAPQSQRPQPAQQNRPAQPASPKRFCPQCGQRQEGNENFCAGCGAKLR